MARGLIRAGELAAMREVAETILPTLCTLQAPTVTRDDTGGGTASWTATTNVPCRLSMVQATGPQISNIASQFQVHAPFVLSLEWDRTVAAGYRAIVNGDTYEVLNVADDHDDRVLRRAYLRRVDN